MKTLKDYSTEELRRELADRLKDKWVEKRKERKPYYSYCECKVISVRENGYGRGLNRFDFILEKDLGYHREKYKGYVLGTDYGFKMANMPQVGDIVEVRKRNYVNPAHDFLGEWKICKIIKRGYEQ